jgi:hypothetical protein
MRTLPDLDSDGPYIVIEGDPVAGFIFVGPFGSFEAAERWADDRVPTRAEADDRVAKRSASRRSAISVPPMCLIAPTLPYCFHGRALWKHAPPSTEKAFLYQLPFLREG